MRSSLIGVLFIASGLLILTGCTSAKRVDPEGPDVVTTVSRLDIQDAREAAEQLSESLLASGILGSRGKPSVIAIDQYVDTTGEGIDRDEVLKKIRVTLNKAGVAQTMTSIDDEGRIGGESAIASKAARQRLRDQQIDAFLNDEEAPEGIYPDYALTFKIMDNRVRTGILRFNEQVTFIFQMSLTDVSAGVAVWEEETQITKQGGVLQQ